MPWAILTPPRTGLFRNVWLMGAYAVLLTPEGSHRKAHSIAMGREHHELEGGFNAASSLNDWDIDD